MAASMSQRIVAEFLGTFGLLLIGGGAAVFTLPTFDFTSRDVAVSLAFGGVLLALAYAFGDLSGAHFNPAVTVSLATSGRFKWADVPGYLIAQILGGLVGIAVVYGIVTGGGSEVSSVAQGAALGSQCFSGFGAPAGCGYTVGAVFLIEVALGFVFILVIQLVTRPESSAKNLAPVAIGLALVVTNLMAIPVDGASLNPVRSFSPALISAIAWPSARWAIQESWLFWIAPIVGGALAAIAERVLRPN
ncbi:MAG TPA: aquaporin [Thermoplasmata archaeon]|nr:aquaporin [Thermoplasmata archaeon]